MNVYHISNESRRTRRNNQKVKYSYTNVTDILCMISFWKMRDMGITSGILWKTIVYFLRHKNGLTTMKNEKEENFLSNVTKKNVVFLLHTNGLTTMITSTAPTGCWMYVQQIYYKSTRGTYNVMIV